MKASIMKAAVRNPFHAAFARVFSALLLYFAAGPGLFALGEKTLVIGGEAGWSAAQTRRAVAEISGCRPFNVMILDSASSSGENAGLDMAITFNGTGAIADEAGHYSVTVSPRVQRAGSRLARTGTGAALFSGASTSLDAAPGADPLVITPLNMGALLAGEQRLQDFSIEFWINPVNLESGGQILYWTAARSSGSRRNEVQWILCETSRNRLQWTFHNFFTAPFDGHGLDAAFSGISTVTPGIWSRHEIRFDADTGALEYLVNGASESIVYMTSTGREGGDVFTPVAGRGSRMVLGGRYAGLMDEFRVYGAAESPVSQSGGLAAAPRRGGERYPLSGGRFETSFLDLGQPGSQVVKIDATGGLLRNGRRAGYGQTGYGQTGNSPAGGRMEVLPEYLAGTTGDRFSFPDASAMRFFVRTAATPFPGEESVWRAVAPGRDLDIRGRYAQIAVEFYPSGDGENTPWLEEIRLSWLANEPPRPPSYIAASARDGAVELVWNASASRDVAGYLVYFGTKPGEYFGTNRAASPLDTGRQTSFRIEGLQNGVLYYFAVSAYDSTGASHGGEFSREVSARPLRMIE